MRIGRRAAEFVIVVGLGLETAAAQQSAPPVLPAIEVSGNASADRLRAQAEALYGQPSQLRRAAVLHEREAAQRNPADPRLVEALDRAARLYAYSGDFLKGRTLMHQAARSALECGSVERAAHAYLDAAFIALQGKEVSVALDLTAKAERLSMSPLLSTAQKVAIVQRIDPAKVKLNTK